MTDCRVSVICRSWCDNSTAIFFLFILTVAFLFSLSIFMMFASEAVQGFESEKSSRDEDRRWVGGVSGPYCWDTSSPLAKYDFPPP